MTRTDPHNSKNVILTPLFYNQKDTAIKAIRLSYTVYADPPKCQEKERNPSTN